MFGLCKQDFGGFWCFGRISCLGVTFWGFDALVFGLVCDCSEPEFVVLLFQVCCFEILVFLGLNFDVWVGIRQDFG